MAEKIQIHPRISVESSDVLRHAAEARGCAQGDLLEEALTAFLQDATTPANSLPHDLLTRLDTLEASLAALPDTLDALIAPVCAYLMALEEAIRGVIARCDTLLTRVPAPPPPKPPDPPQRIATYEQMYGPPETWVDPYPLPASQPLDPPKRRLFSRLFFKEVQP